MHILYYPLVTNDLQSARRDASWARQVVRDTPNGWQCVLLFRPEQDMDEFALWERSRAFTDALDAAARKAADSAYLLAQRIVTSLREGGIDANEAFRYAILVCDGSKLHFYVRGFRCLLWGVPAEGSPPLRLVQEDKRNVIESREFPGLKARSDLQAAPFVARPVVAIVDEVEPDGVLAGFTKSLETLLVLGGPVSLHRAQQGESARGDSAIWHVWEELANLAAVDLRRLEGRLDNLADRIGGLGLEERSGSEIWQRVQRHGPLVGVAIAILLLLVLLFRGGGAPAVLPAPPEGTAAHPSAALASAESGVAAPREDPAPEPIPPSPPSPPTAPPVAERPQPQGADATVAAFLRDTTPVDRVHFTRPVKQFVDERVLAFLDGEPLSEKNRRTMADVAVQLLANRVCAQVHGPVRVDGAVGERTLQQLRRCARDGEPVLEAVVEAYGDASVATNVDNLAAQVARTIIELTE